MNKSYIQDIAYYLPEKVLTNDDLMKEFPDANIRAMGRLIGITSRHIGAKGETASDMCFKAAEKLFAQGKADREKIDFILFNSAAPDYLTPATSCVLQDRLNIPVGQAGATDLSQGCSGYITGLSIAKGLVESGTAKNVLFLTSEVMSWRLHPKDYANRMIFGDAAAATLISNEPKGGMEIGKMKLGSDGSGYDKIIVKYGGGRYPLPECAEPDFVDEAGNIRNHANFFMDGTAIFNFAARVVPPLIMQLSEINETPNEQIDYFVLHQANKFILETVFKKMDIDRSRRVYDMADVGNTVSASIPIVLKRMEEKGMEPQKKCLMLTGFGVGLSWGGVVLKPAE